MLFVPDRLICAEERETNFQVYITTIVTIIVTIIIVAMLCIVTISCVTIHPIKIYAATLSVCVCVSVCLCVCV